MDAFDKLVAKHFPQAGPLQMLMEMVEKELDGFVPSNKVLQEQKEGQEVKIFLPTIKITEDWGKVSKEGVPTEDRQIIEMYTKNIKGSTVADKINYLNAMIAGEQKDAKLKDILGTLVVLEVLSNILEEFTESAGGFIFEAFLAGLFGGQSVQIIEPEGESAALGKPITDVVLSGREYSLKLLGAGTDVKGSFRNMVEHFNEKDHVVYLDARRNKANSALEFGEFTITLLQFLDVFYMPLRKKVTVKPDPKKAKTIKSAKKFKEFLGELGDADFPITQLQFSKPFPVFGEEDPGAFAYTLTKGASSGVSTKAVKNRKLSPEDFSDLLARVGGAREGALDAFGPFAAAYTESVFGGSKAEKLFGSLEEIAEIDKAISANNKEEIIRLLRLTPGYVGEKQFLFTRGQVEKGIKNFQPIGTLQLGEDVLKQTWLQYGELLNATIGPVYEALNSFSTNISSYFLEAGDVGQKRRQAGMKAIGDAEKLKDATVAATEVLAKEK